MNSTNLIITENVQTLDELLQTTDSEDWKKILNKEIYQLNPQLKFY
jgi:hypothetical protein